MLALLAVEGALYAGTDDGLHVSTDAGRAWTPARGLPADTAVPGLSRAPGALYAATARGPYTSDDGRLWRPLGPGLPVGAPVLSIAADPADGQRLFAGTARNGIYRSRDGGLTWEPASAGLPPDLAVYTIAPDPARPGRLLAGTIGAGLVRSDDGGATWAPAGSGIPPRTNVFAILSTPGGRLALGTSAGFIGSADGGETWSWSRAALGHTRVLALAVDPAAPERLIAGADDGVHLSPDAGRTWRRLAEGVPADEHVGAVAVVGRRVIVGAGPAYAVDLP